MLLSNSLPQLWLIYGLLSLVVLVTGHLGIRFLPRLPRWVVTGLVAGIIWMPASYALPTLDQAEPHSGIAPAVVVTAVAVLQGKGGAMAGAALLLAIGAALGAALGLMIWRLGRRPAAPQARGAEQPTTSSHERREPVIG
ncbi:hypothetical protein [Halomonas sp. YLGW01]|uniref:hypothetical protein n=1 Tax=Halomonas sp. YLGW01 TaxID=2773308 RepID=UPI001787584E|nr:hypothetical protein [Halomonas sp. YLGW01]